MLGTRHEIHLVARVEASLRLTRTTEGRAYAPIARVYSRYCDPTKLMKSVRRFAILAKQPDNAEIIRDELRRVGKDLFDRHPSEYLCGLIASSLLYPVELEDNSPAGLYPSLEEMIMYVGYPMLWHEENTEALTIIDVTDPENLSYCLLSGPSTLMDPDSNIDEYTIREHEGRLLSAEELLREWFVRFHPGSLTHMDTCPVQECERCHDLQQEFTAAQAFENDFPYMDPRIVQETWRGMFLPDLPIPYNLGLFLHVLHPARTPQTQLQLSHFTFPRLSDLLIRPTIDHILGSGDMKDIEQLTMLPGREELIISTIQSLGGTSSLALSDAGVDILASLIETKKDNVTLDLSSFALTEDQVLRVAVRVPEAQVLKLSHNPLVTINTVLEVLKAMPKLKRLVLLDTQITEKDWIEALTDHSQLFYRLNSLVHSCFLRMVGTFYPPAFTYKRYSGSRAVAASIPFFSNDYLLRTLTNIMHNLTDHPSADVFLSTDGESDPNNDSWNQRHIPAFAQSPPVQSVGGSGWIFVVSTSFSGNRYGFIKQTHPANQGEHSTNQTSTGTSATPDASWDLYDISGFLDELEREGRPPFSKTDRDFLRELFTKCKIPRRTGGLPGMFGVNNGISLISRNKVTSYVRPTQNKAWRDRPLTH